MKFLGSAPVPLPSVQDLAEQKEQLRLRLRVAKLQSHVNYSDPAAFVAYDSQYFYRNLYKYLMVAAYRQTSAQSTDAVLTDLGCGVGAFTLAWLMMARELRRPEPVSAVLVDTGAMQLAVATATLEHFGLRQILPRREDARTHAADPASLTLCGYLAASVSDAAGENFVLSAVGSKFVIVDYAEVVEAITVGSLLRHASEPVHLWTKVPSNNLTDVKTTTISAYHVAAI